MINILRGLCDNHEMTVIVAIHDHKMLDKSDRNLWIKDGMKDRLGNRAGIENRVE